MEHRPEARIQEGPWSFAFDRLASGWEVGELSILVSHSEGGFSLARLCATRSATGEVILKLCDPAEERRTQPTEHGVCGEDVGPQQQLQQQQQQQRQRQGDGPAESSTNEGARGDEVSPHGDVRHQQGRSPIREGAHRATSCSPSTSTSPSAPPSSSSSSSIIGPDDSAAGISGQRSPAATATLQRESLLLLLPAEIQQHIYSFLPITEIFATLPLVCKDICQKTQRDDVFWHGIYDIHFGGPCDENKLETRKKKARTKRRKQQQTADAEKPEAAAAEGGDDKTTTSPAGAAVADSESADEDQEKGKEEKQRKKTALSISISGGGGSISVAGEEETDENGAESEPEDLFWRKECARLMKELRDMEEDFEREIALLDMEVAKKKRKKARLHRRKRIKYAVEKGHLPLMRQFIRAADVPVDVPLTEKEATPLMFAAIRGNVPIVNWLLANGANVNAVEEGCAWQPIIHASQGGHAEVVKILLSQGANVNAMTEKGGTPLMHATYEGYEEVVKILLENGADVNIQSKNGESALMMAAEKGHANIVRLLLEVGADTTLATHQSKRTAIWFAKENKQEEVVALFDEFAKKEQPQDAVCSE